MGRKSKDVWQFTYEQKERDARRHKWQKLQRAMENADWEEAMQLQDELGYRRKDGTEIYPGDPLVEAIWNGKID